MADFIDTSKIVFRNLWDYDETGAGVLVKGATAEEISAVPSSDVVTRDCFNLILWQNDIMRKQLADIGKKFGEKMDGVRHVVFCSECRHRGWIQEPCHGKSVDFCRKLEHPVDERFWCAMGERKESDG